MHFFGNMLGLDPYDHPIDTGLVPGILVLIDVLLCQLVNVLTGPILRPLDDFTSDDHLLVGVVLIKDAQGHFAPGLQIFGLDSACVCGVHKNNISISIHPHRTDMGLTAFHYKSYICKILPINKFDR